ncbi:MAG: anhydro-N-acetylmuramic acid kinase [Propionibacteriaceae bacterium]|jgi:anhydro-N-acetylmuramic acid kinase|nr:anhydro-N-acetylmuramic acid kinase [Propionibacteriaceae bacterium]
MKVVGLISGTSHDGIDAAVVDFKLLAEGVLQAGVLSQGAYPYSPELRSRLLAALPPAAIPMAEVCELDTLIGQAFATAAADIIATAGGAEAVCSHGQTVYHWVIGNQALGTLQLGQPAWIAQRTGLPVVADIRIRDITAGGQGAPLASFIDALVLGADQIGAGLNLGGIANTTVVSPAGVLAFDTGPANALIDAVVVEYGLHPSGYDEGGRIAASGKVDTRLLAQLLDEPYYRLEPPKTTGKELFHAEYLHGHLELLGYAVAPVDLVSTVTELTVRTVGDALRQAADSSLALVAVSGGGAHNQTIMNGLRRELPGINITTTADLGLPVDTKEAILMALIGWCTLHGVPAIVPGGTGASAPCILGSITPGAGSLLLPAPTAPLQRLCLT